MLPVVTGLSLKAGGWGFPPATRQQRENKTKRTY